MNKINNYLGIAALSIALLGCSTQAADNKSESPASQSKLPVDAKVVAYSTLTQEESVAGSILPNREVQITSELSKKVASVNFADGSYVSKGQLLYKLEDAEIRARLKQSHAELSMAKLNESRLAKLLKSESVRQEEYDVALSKLQSLEASEELLQVELAKTSITAPFSGVVGITKVEVGAIATPGLPLVIIQEQRMVKVQFTVSEKYLSQLKKGNKIHFVLANGSERFSAKISATESGIDMQSRTITVHALTSNTNGTLKPGMSARVYFSTVSSDAKGLTLPTEALIPSAQGYSVFVVKNGSAKITPVTIGNRDEAEALITSGLNNGDTVMISNILRSGDGTPVEVVSIK